MTTTSKHISTTAHICEFLTISLFAVGLARFSFHYRFYSDPYPICLNHFDKLSVIARNLGVAGVILLLFNFLKNWTTHFRRLSLVFWTLNRYFLIYLLIPETVNKIMGNFYQYSFSLAYERLMNTKPRNLYWQVYAQSDQYEVLIGIAEVIIIILLSFRRTSILGALLLLPIILNNFGLAIVNESCGLYHYITLLAFLTAIIIHRIPNIINWMKAHTFTPLFNLNKKQFKLLYGSLVIVKVILITGFMMQNLWQLDRYRGYNAWAQNHPFVGIWSVDSICAPTSSFPKFNKLIFEKSREGVVEVDDSLSKMKYIVDTLYNQMEMYDFWEFRSIDLKGKYTFIDSTHIEYIGRNNKDSIYLFFSKEPNSPEN